MTLSASVLVVLVALAAASVHQLSAHGVRRASRPLRRVDLVPGGPGGPGGAVVMQVSGRVASRPGWAVRRALLARMAFAQPQQQQQQQQERVVADDHGWPAAAAAAPDEQLQVLESPGRPPPTQQQQQQQQQQVLDSPPRLQQQQQPQLQMVPEPPRPPPQQQPQQQVVRQGPSPSQEDQRTRSPPPPPPPPLAPSLPPLASITFFVFTRDARPGVLHTGDDATLYASGFSTARPTKVLIHGFGSNVNRTMMTTIKDAYLLAMDVNVVSVDWSPLSAAPWYPVARSNVEVVGPRVADLLDWLASRGVALESVHLVGHSLGAHVAGIAGSALRSGRLYRISGLDPARPGFRDVDPRRRLDPSDALLVDVIHTTSGFLGLEQPVGHTDFYPNGGTMSQPGCLPDLAGLCSHEKAFRIFRDSISDVDFAAVGCDSMQDALQGQCRGRAGIMGEHSVRTQPGIYYAVTR